MPVEDHAFFEGRRAIPVDKAVVARKVLLAAVVDFRAPPSLERDSQFPVDASIEMYQSLIAPLDDCLEGADRLIWEATGSLGALPISILLPEAPPRTAQG